MNYAGNYLISKKQAELPGFRYLELKDGWILSCHTDLKYRYDIEKDILLLGTAWQVLPEKGMPEDEIAGLEVNDAGEAETGRLLEMESSWCGHYVLIHRGIVIPDASTMLGIYYAADGISSDCSLLAETLGLERTRYHCGKSMNWMPAPLTPYPGIRRLLPSQIYEYRTGAVTGRQLLTDFHETEKEKLHARLTACYDASFRNLRMLYPPETEVYIALTGGYDSRTTFAMAKHAALDFKAFSFEHGEMLEGDIRIPQVLCEKTGTQFLYVRRHPGSFEQEREDAYLEHTSGLVMDEDRLAYAHGQYDAIAGQDSRNVLLRSSIYEDVIDYFSRCFEETEPNDEFYRFFEVEKGSLEERSLEEYFQWCRENPQNGINASNRFLWEQREGCWLSYMEQGFGLLEHLDSFQIANCRLLISMLFQYPAEERRTKQHQKELIAYACPEIRDIPFADNQIHGDTPFRWFCRKADRARRRLRKTGLRGTVASYWLIFQMWRTRRKQTR